MVEECQKKNTARDVRREIIVFCAISIRMTYVYYKRFQTWNKLSSVQLICANFFP